MPYNSESALDRVDIGDLVYQTLFPGENTLSEEELEMVGSAVGFAHKSAAATGSARFRYSAERHPDGYVTVIYTGPGHGETIAETVDRKSVV